jgi:hypothetical protein
MYVYHYAVEQILKGASDVGVTVTKKLSGIVHSPYPTHSCECHESLLEYLWDDEGLCHTDGDLHMSSLTFLHGISEGEL